MKVNGVKIHYPNGQTMLEIGDIDNITVPELVQLIGSGLNDLTQKLPELTKTAAELIRIYEEARQKGVDLSKIAGK